MAAVSALAVLRDDVAASGVTLPAADWARIAAQLTEARFPGGAVIFSQGRIADRWLFVARGIAASEQSSSDGGATIARFFEPGQVCANVTSAWRQDFASDDLIAMTPLDGVLLPDPVLRHEYLRGGAFGEYLRLKVMETLLFDKDLLCAKTSTDTAVRFRFLHDRYSEVVQRVPQKDLSRFLGVTPQGLSRFLRSGRWKVD